jgi:hypothetical protein
MAGLFLDKILFVRLNRFFFIYLSRYVFEQNKSHFLAVLLLFQTFALQEYFFRVIDINIEPEILIIKN